MIKVLIVFGTRPEAIKMCPLVHEIGKYDDLKCVVCVTGQHKEMLEQVLDFFGVNANYNLGIMKQQQTLSAITTSILTGMDDVLNEENPDLVLVHGDTSTAMAAALAAFYKRIPVGHVEAGLRTYDIFSPYPEEMNRQIIDRIATYLFAPTENNRNNLKSEGITNNVYVTGNTVIDSLKYTVREKYTFENELLRNVDYDKWIILVTAHRRENWGTNIENICEAVKTLTHIYNDILFVFPVHLNPVVRSVVYAILQGVENVVLTEPLSVFDMHNLERRCDIVLTDSGGLQEEAPAFGKPVLVLRTETERQEAVDAGTAKVIGCEINSIIDEVSILHDNHEMYEKMASADNPYGDGMACKRIVDIIRGKESKRL